VKVSSKTVLKWVMFFDGPACVALGVLAVQNPATATWALTLAAFLGAIGTSTGITGHVQAGKDHARALRAAASPQLQPSQTEGHP
jgi:uncharacterized membrane protein HdeD (DUF308 family)